MSGSRGVRIKRGEGRSVMKLDKIRRERCSLQYTARLYAIHDRFYISVFGCAR